MGNAVGYARFSSSNQTEASIEAQTREISAYASLKGFSLLKIYVDREQSGYASDRPDFQQMISDSAEGFFETVIVHKYDRFARDGDDAPYYERVLRKNNVSLVSVEEQLDDTTPEGLLLKRLIMGINEFYGKNLAREVMKGQKTNALKCLHTGGLAPLGYDVNPDKTYSLNVREAESVQIIFEMRTSGYSYNEIMNRLNQEERKTKIGRNFGKNSLYEILKNEKYTGVYIFNKTAGKDMNGKFNRRRYKDEKEIIRIKDGMPQIISESLFLEVQNIMNQNRHKNATNKANAEYLLSGVVQCSECGQSMVGNTSCYTKGGKEYTYGYYECSARKRTCDCTNLSIRRDLLEKEVLECLNSMLSSDSNINRIYHKLLQMEKANDGSLELRLSEIRNEVAALDRKINNGNQAVLEGLNTPELKELLSTLSRQRELLKMELIQLENTPTTEKLLDGIIDEYKYFSKIEQLPFKQRRAVVQRLVQKVIVFPISKDKKSRPIRIVLSGHNPSEKLTNLLDMGGSALSPPKRFKSEHTLFCICKRNIWMCFHEGY